MLNQCPFCGEVGQEVTAREVYEKCNSGCISVSCKCGCDLYLFTDAETPYEEAVKKAVDKWNTRVKAWDMP